MPIMNITPFLKDMKYERCRSFWFDCSELHPVCANLGMELAILTLLVVAVWFLQSGWIDKYFSTIRSFTERFTE